MYRFGYVSDSNLVFIINLLDLFDVLFSEANEIEFFQVEINE